MKTILIYGNNKISAFLHTAFGESGLVTVDITQKISSIDDPKDIYAVLDVSNADVLLPEETVANPQGETKELLDLALKVKSPYIYLYREKEESSPESPLVASLDFIKIYSRNKGIKYASVQIEDIYGTEINTSKKLEEYISGLSSASNILTVDSDENEHYLLHQKDFKSGLKEIIRTLNEPESKSKHYTLYPEDSITEIELAHFIKELVDINIEIVYTHEEIPTSFVLPEAEISYPENWYPEIEFEAGIEDLCDYAGIPLKKDAVEELAEEEKVVEDDPFEAANIEPEEEPLELDIEPNHNDQEDDLLEKADDFEKDDFLNDGFDNYRSRQDDYAYVEAVKKPQDNQQSKPAKTKKRSKKTLAALAVLLLLALGLPTFTFAYNTTAGLIYLSMASESIKNSNLDAAYKSSNTASYFLNKDEEIPLPVRLTANAFGIPNDDQYLFISTNREMAQAITYLSGVDLYATFQSADSHKLAMDSDSKVLGASTVASPEYIDKSLEKIEKVENNLQSFETNNQFLRNLINNNLISLSKNKDKLLKIRTIEPSIDKLLGYNKKQTYLLLLQNNAIGRSSGGEVEVYGLITAENGKLSITKLEKSSDAHSQLDINGTVAAPELIKSITDQEYLYMEDLSWDPDFKNVSKTALNLYSHLGNETINGVISIDTNVMLNLINSMGEIKVGEKSMNAEAFAQILTKSENADDMKNAFYYIFNNIRDNEEAFKKLEPILFEGLNSKDVLVYHEDESTYSNILKNDWGGILKDQNTDEFLYFANNNLTDIPSSKVSSEISYEGRLPTDKDGYIRTVEIKYTNTADSDYVGHLIAIVPGDTMINSAKIITASGEKNIIRSIQSSKYDNKVMYETDMYIPTKDSVSLKIEYQSPLKNYDDKYIDISIQKQPGTGSSPLSIKLVGDTTQTSTVTFDSDKNLKFPL